MSHVTGKDLLLHSLQGGATRRAGWVPFVGVHGAKMLGISAREYLQSADRIVDGLLAAHQRYRPDGLPVVFDLQMEAEVLGCDLRWADDTPPAVVSHPLAQGGVDLPPRFDLSAGRFPLVLEALRRTKGEIGRTTALYGLITGPFTLTLHLMGTRVFLDMLQDPDAVQQVIEFCADVGVQTAEAYLKHGADVVAVVDPMTSQISPDHFEAFVAEPVNRVFSHIRDRGGLSSMFVCGNATRNLERMCRTRCDNVSIDENVPLEMLKELAGRYGRSFGGNMKLTTVLLLGDPDDAKLEAIRCMEIGGTNGFVLAPGCDLPYATPEANLEAVALMVHDDYQRHVANATLRVKTARSFDDVVLPDYASEPRVIVDVVTLDSASCAPCQYMVDAARQAAAAFGDRVAVYERKITTHEGLGFMTRLGVENIPTLCIHGRPRFASIIPDATTLTQALEAAVKERPA